jgi:hypothetical protein
MDNHWTLNISAPTNGRVHQATVTVLNDDGTIRFTDKADLMGVRERKKLAQRLAERLQASVPDLEATIESGWASALNDHREQQRQNLGPAPDATNQITALVLDGFPDAIRRPLCLVREHAYAAVPLCIQVTTQQTVDPQTGAVTRFDPPRVEHLTTMAIVRSDGVVFLDAGIPEAKPMSEVGVTVSLPTELPPDRAWSGAGLKRFLAGERPGPAEVFDRMKQVVNRFMDFRRSLASQEVLCELTACYILGTYLLDAFSVIGYLWPNGDKGAGKTNYLFVVTELAYLGQVILAGGSYASLRDLADYGATLAFDDAEGIMDVRKADPDKRALLLAGNRRGASVTVKEPAGDRGWVTRYIHAFCPRLFSAIRLPDEVLGSRTIIVPLVRSADEHRAKASPLDHTTWPCDRRRLLDDLWAVSLANLPKLRTYDAQAAGRARLSGRDLEPWRSILAVALWLQEEHGVEELFQRMEELSVVYQTERGDLEARDATRLAIRALQQMASGHAGNRAFDFTPTELAKCMNDLAHDDDQADDDGEFTNARKVGWLLKKLRIKRATGDGKNRRWTIAADELKTLAQAYGMSDPPKGPGGRDTNDGADVLTF